MSIAERIENGIRRKPLRDDRTIAKCVRGATVGMVREVRKRLNPEFHITITKQPKQPAHGRPFESFVNENDVRTMIRHGIDRYLQEEGNLYYEDAEFMSLCGATKHNWRRYADDPEFRNFRLVRGSRNLWAPAPMIFKMKRILES